MDKYFKNLFLQFVEKCLIFRIKKTQHYTLKDGLGKCSVTIRKEEKSETEKNESQHCGASSLCFSVNIFTILYIIEKFVESSITSWYSGPKLRFILEINRG